MSSTKTYRMICMLALSWSGLLQQGFAQTPTDREQALQWFEKQKQFAQGSVVEQYYLQKAIEADPTFSPALKEKSVPYNKRGLYAEGFRLLNQAVTADPVEHLGYRGFVKLYMLRDYEGALADFIRLDSLTPNFRDAPWSEDIEHVKGIAYLMLKKRESAITSFSDCIRAISAQSGEDWVDVKVFLYRGIAYLEMAQLELALADFNKALELYPKFSEAWYYKGITFAKMGQAMESCEALQ
ncbi:MAG: tetratricopeptide repeat protein, partial [Phaeodactylibacter sp.]|nr:tetratricopeptide repeat protein [Phaeodactylibacter sp.]